MAYQGELFWVELQVWCSISRPNQGRIVDTRKHRLIIEPVCAQPSARVQWWANFYWFAVTQLLLSMKTNSLRGQDYKHLPSSLFAQ